MQNVYVSFPPNGSPIVNPDDEAVVSGHQVTWHVESFNPSVKTVLIEFEDVKGTIPKYFSTFTSGNVKGTPGSLEKGLGPRTRPVGSKEPPCWVATLWGVAPSPGRGLARRDKYWVKGFDASGTVVEEVDPKIVTSDP